jgi:hypothetical protein
MYRVCSRASYPARSGQLLSELRWDLPVVEMAKIQSPSDTRSQESTCLGRSVLGSGPARVEGEWPMESGRESPGTRTPPWVGCATFRLYAIPPQMAEGEGLELTPGCGVSGSETIARSPYPPPPDPPQLPLSGGLTVRVRSELLREDGGPRRRRSARWLGRDG